MKKEFVNLYEIVVHVDADLGMRNVLRKYRTSFTGKNYIPTRMTDEDEKNGYTHNLYQRVPVDDILKVQRIGRTDECSCLTRYIYFLEGQEEEAITFLRANIDSTVQQMKRDAVNLHRVWTKRIPRKAKA